MSSSSVTVLSGDIEAILRKEFPPKKLMTKFKPKPKARVVVPSALGRIFGSGKHLKRHYFTSGVKINNDNQRNLLTEMSPFKYPQSKDEFSYRVVKRAWDKNLRKKELSLNAMTRNSYRSRQNLDILNRLYVEEPKEQSMRTIFDIDPDFFTIVEGRPIADKFNIKSYVKDLRDILRAKIITGYREDEIILLNENFKMEQEALTEISERVQTYINAYEEFLYQDHNSSMHLLRLAEDEANLANQKYEIYRVLSTEYGVLKSQVYSLEERWNNLKLYQKFLYLVSPMEWRKQYDFYHFKKDKIIPDPSSLFDEKGKADEETMSLNDLIEVFLEDCKTQDEPRLYFQSPKELLRVFRFIEEQNLNSLIHSEELAVPLENIKIGMNQAKKKFELEIQKLQEMIDNLQEEILWQEERADALQKLAQELINSVFCKVISDEEVLNLHVFIEDVYETRVGANDANLNIVDMMTGIEVLYRNYLLELDKMPQDKVHKAESESYAEEDRIMKMAMEAARKVVQIDRLAKRLERVLEPPFVRTVKELKTRSPPFDPPPKPKLPPRPLTHEEDEFLVLFTDYCKFTDDVLTYGIDVKKDPVVIPGTPLAILQPKKKQIISFVPE